MGGGRWTGLYLSALISRVEINADYDDEEVRERTQASCKNPHRRNTRRTLEGGEGTDEGGTEVYGAEVLTGKNIAFLYKDAP